MPTELPYLGCEFSRQRWHAKTAHYCEVTESFNDLPVNLRSTSPQVKIVDNLKQFFSACTVPRSEYLTNEHVDLSNQLSLTGTIGGFVLAATIKDHLFPGSFISSDFPSTVTSSQSLDACYPAMAVKADNRKIGHAAITRVSIYVVYLNVLSRLVADATGVIISVQNFVRRVGGNWQPDFPHGRNIPATVISDLED